MSGVDLKFNKGRIRSKQREAYAAISTIGEGIKIHVLKYLKQSSPVHTGFLKDNWDVTAHLSGDKRSFTEGKTNLVTILITITNPAKYTSYLREPYQQAGKQLLFAYRNPNGKLDVIGAMAIKPKGPNHRERRDRLRANSRSSKLLTLATTVKTINPTSDLSKDAKYERTIERRVAKYVTQRLRRSTSFVGVVSIDFKTQGRHS